MASEPRLDGVLPSIRPLIEALQAEGRRDYPASLQTRRRSRGGYLWRVVSAAPCPDPRGSHAACWWADEDAAWASWRRRLEQARTWGLA